MKTVAMLCGLLVLPCAMGIAVEEPGELVTDRPDQTESAVVIPLGYAQLETGAVYTGGDGDSISFPGTLARIGLGHRTELRLGLEGWDRAFDADTRPSFGDAEVGAKVRLWDEEGWVPEAALLLGTSVPIGEGSGEFDPAFRLSFAHTLSERLSFGYNAGMAWETVEDEPRHARRIASLYPDFQLAEVEPDEDTLARFEYTASLGIGLTERLGAFIEVFGDAPLNAKDGPAQSLDGGLTFQLRPNLQLDLSGGVGLNDAADDWFLSAGVSVRLPR